MKYRDKIIERFMKDPALLYAWMENDIIDVAMSGVTMWEQARESDAYQNAHDLIGRCVGWAQDRFCESPLAAEWEAEYEQEERDYIRDQEIDAKMEEQRENNR